MLRVQRADSHSQECVFWPQRGPRRSIVIGRVQPAAVAECGDEQSLALSVVRQRQNALAGHARKLCPRLAPVSAAPQPCLSGGSVERLRGPAHDQVDH